jgi:hypothetical protein
MCTKIKQNHHSVSTNKLQSQKDVILCFKLGISKIIYPLILENILFNENYPVLTVVF